jgi:hypothetical protein
MRSIKSFSYSNDQLIILSLIPDKDNINIKINNIDKNNNIISKNKLELLDNIKLIDKKKLKKCTLCNNEFSKISELFNFSIFLSFSKEYRGVLIENNIKIENKKTLIISL